MWPMAIASIASWLGGRAKKKQLDEWQAYQERMDAPRRAGVGFLLGQLGKDNPLLRAQFLQQKEETTQTGATAGQRAKAYFGSRGAPGRARGEQQRTEAVTQEQQNKLALGYASEEESQQNRIAAILAGQPIMSEAPAIAAKAEASGDVYGDFASLMGDIAGMYQFKEMMAAETANNNAPPPPPAIPASATSFEPTLRGPRSLQDTSYSRARTSRPSWLRV